MYTIVIVDDEKGMLHFLKKIFELKNFEVFSFLNGFDALKFLKENSVDTVLLDVKLPDISGLDVLKEIKKINPDIPVIIMTAYAEIDGAVEFIKNGAYDYVAKPFPKEKILEMVKNSCEKFSLLKENYRLKKELHNISFSPKNIIWQSPQMEEILSLARKVAPTDVTVLIQGETGTGKELLSQYIHYYSKRADKIFFPVNCSTFSNELFESHLFGHKKGSFTGAVNDNKGILKEIDGGTLFLDEISEIPIDIQVKLLRLIQNKEFLPVGASKIEKVNVRIIVATNKNLSKEVENGKFRKDLFYRLNVISINIPPLRSRPEDIKALILHFIKKFSIKFNKIIRGIDNNALKLLENYNFPGNVRELENIIERSVLLAKSDILTVETLPLDICQHSATMDIFNDILPLEDVIRNYIHRVYIFTGKNKQKTADILKVSRKTVSRKLQEI